MAREPADRDVEIVSTFLFSSSSILNLSLVFYFTLHSCDSIHSLQSYLVARICSYVGIFPVSL
jgi:hypothetical protein